MGKGAFSRWNGIAPIAAPVDRSEANVAVARELLNVLCNARNCVFAGFRDEVDSGPRRPGRPRGRNAAAFETEGEDQSAPSVGKRDLRWRGSFVKIAARTDV